MALTSADKDALTRIGVISDTHGLTRREALDALSGSQLIIHAGDIGSPDILEQLKTIAPIVAVRGNVDHGGWVEELPYTEEVIAGAHRLHVLHILNDLEIDPVATGVAAVIYGHSHKPSISYSEGVLYFNPGSAGPRRFALPITVGRLSIVGDRLRPEIVEIEP